MGLCLEPPQFVTGLARVPNGSRGQAPLVLFEQYERHTAWYRAGGLANRGYDTKYAMHALRLGLQGIELLTTGRITLPAPPPHRDTLRAVRRGEFWLADVLDMVTGAEVRLTELRDSSALPDQPDRPWVQRLAAPQLPKLLGRLIALALAQVQCWPSFRARWASGLAEVQGRGSRARTSAATRSAAAAHAGEMSSSVMKPWISPGSRRSSTATPASRRRRA